MTDPGAQETDHAGTQHDEPPQHDVDVVVIGAGPAGLSAALNLVRARRRVLVLDGNRPRNAATLRSHGFVTRDGVSPLELRKLGRAEVEAYPEATFVQAIVDRVEQMVPANDGGGASDQKVHPRFRIAGAWRGMAVTATARAVVVATGLVEEFPALPSLRAFYGTAMHSCVECDGYEKADAPIAFIGETDDLATRALLIAAWSSDLVVFTNGVARVTADERARLVSAGVRVEDRRIADLEGDRSGMTGVRLEDGEVVPRVGGFVRPRWRAELPFLDGMAMGGAAGGVTGNGASGITRDEDGLVMVDRAGRTGVPGLYAVGDVTPPGPEQLIVAAGAGAITAAAVHRDLVGGVPDLWDAVQ